MHTAAVGQNNNTVMLDLLSSISGGKMLYSDTHAAFPRKLAKLVLDLKHPLASDLMVTAVTEGSKAHIEFYTASSHLPLLYAGQPYTIYGHIDEPCDFDLILQGRHKEEWMAIKKKVVFSEGKKATRSLEKQWLSERAKIHYNRFLTDGKSSHLKEAEAILQ
ncbi:MAG: hypothetical protein HYZ48_04230 [Chlamydiales bacterium]|nr:hypothetical protein [Chlamydiales bacterium]